MLSIKDNFKKYKILKIDQLVKADWNYKEEDLELTEKLKNNIKRNGQIENIIVRQLDTGFYEVVNGNHRYDAMKDLGYVDIIVCDESPMSLSEAKRTAIESNETRFKTDNVKLGGLIAELVTEGNFSKEELEQTMPFNYQQIEELSQLHSFDWNQFSGGEGEGNDQSNNSPNDKMDMKTLLLKLDANVYEAWTTWIDRVKQVIPQATEQRAFEIMVIESLNNPDILNNLK